MPVELPHEFKMFDAYLDFLDDGKLRTFAKLAAKYPEASSLFIRAINDLDSGRAYPSAVTRLLKEDVTWSNSCRVSSSLVTSGRSMVRW